MPSQSNKTTDKELRDEPRDDCWLWAFKPTSFGYARLRVGNRTQAAHRFVYEALVGDVPDGLVLDHLCRVRNCVNPEHLEPVTNRENILRGVSPVAMQAKQPHCKRGHEYTKDNLVPRSDGWRECLTCRREIHEKKPYYKMYTPAQKERIRNYSREWYHRNKRRKLEAQ